MRIQRTTLLTLLGGREDLLEQLMQEGLLPRDEAALTVDHAELARVVHTLSQELDVNWAGVEVILHMRSELIATRRQVGLLVELLRTRPRQ
jgi:hypothetical protein